MVRTKNSIREVEDLALQLQTLGRFCCDSAQAVTEHGKLLLDSAEWLRKLSGNMCGAGYIGCTGGPECDLDHK